MYSVVLDLAVAFQRWQIYWVWENIWKVKKVVKICISWKSYLKNVILAETITRGCSAAKVFIKILQNYYEILVSPSKESCRLEIEEACNVNKKRLQSRCFSVNFVYLLRTFTLLKTCERLLIKWEIFKNWRPVHQKRSLESNETKSQKYYLVFNIEQLFKGQLPLNLSLLILLYYSTLM